MIILCRDPKFKAPGLGFKSSLSSVTVRSCKASVGYYILIDMISSRFSFLY